MPLETLPAYVATARSEVPPPNGPVALMRGKVCSNTLRLGPDRPSGATTRLALRWTGRVSVQPVRGTRSGLGRPGLSGSGRPARRVVRRRCGARRRALMPLRARSRPLPKPAKLGSKYRRALGDHPDIGATVIPIAAIASPRQRSLGSRVQRATLGAAPRARQCAARGSQPDARAPGDLCRRLRRLTRAARDSC
jgi:hypothetical protein